MRSLALALASIALVPVAAPAVQEEDEAHARLMTRLDEVQGLLRSRRWDPAHEALLAALDEVGEEDFVLQHWSEIEEGLARCAFWKDYEPPEPEDVVGGELRSWNERSGKIKLRYRKGDAGLGDEEDGVAGDFIVAGEGKLRLHPLVFQGPYTIEIECGGIPRIAYGAGPSILVDWPWGSLNSLSNGLHYIVVLGGTSGILEVGDEGSRVLERSSTSSTLRDPFEAKVQVSATRISASIDRSSFRAKRPKSDFGQFGLMGFENIEQIEITGEVEPSWIAGLVDDAIQTDWKEFHESFDALAVVPEWMQVRVKGQSAEERDLLEVLPDGATPEDDKIRKRLVEYFEEDEIEDGVSYIVRSVDDLSDVSRPWFETLARLYEGRLEDALESSRLLVEKVPSFYEGRLLHAQLERANTSSLEAAPVFEELTRDFPYHLEAYEALAELSIMESRPDQAFATIGEAIANGVDPRALAPIERTIYRAKHGPHWGEVFTYESKHYVVSTDLGEKVAWEIGQELEKFYKKYINRVRRPARSDEKFRVFFFSGFTGYADYTGDLLGDPAHGTLGLYSPWLKQLVIWNSSEKAMVMRTVRHEGFHQYLDVITSEAPVWFNEGMAEYYEQARIVGGNWKDDQINDDHVALLRAVKKHWTPLRDFVYGDTRSFRVKQGLHYPQAWALCHYLYNTTRENEQIAETLLDALYEGKTRHEALDAAFGDVDFGAMERDLKAYVDTLE